MLQWNLHDLKILRIHFFANGIPDRIGPARESPSCSTIRSPLLHNFLSSIIQSVQIDEERSSIRADFVGLCSSYSPGFGAKNSVGLPLVVLVVRGLHRALPLKLPATRVPPSPAMIRIIQANSKPEKTMKNEHFIQIIVHRTIWTIIRNDSEIIRTQDETIRRIHTNSNQVRPIQTISQNHSESFRIFQRHSA